MSRATTLVSEGKFAFTNGVLFAEASGHNQHRRATQEELRTHFSSGSDKDHTAHWFEAQLIHYGLRPSKVKSVARMRLFDAVRGGPLSVPPHITELEQKLKKEWTKRDRDDKKVAKTMGSTVMPKAETLQKPIARKRKADVTTNATVNRNLPGNTPSPALMTNSYKRAKKSASSETGSASATQYVMKQTARRGGGSHKLSRPEPAIRASPSPSPDPAQAPRPRYMARRGRPFDPRGRMQSSHVQRSGSSACVGSFGGPTASNEDYPEDKSRVDGTASLSPLGRLNGLYDISCPFVESEWPQCASALSLVLTIAGSSLWGRFDLGVIEGVIHFEKRPRSSSLDNIPFSWRGREDEGTILYDDTKNKGWIKFLGDGRIEGRIDYQGIHFDGRILPGQGTRNKIDVRDMKNEWARCSEEEYDWLNQARWG